MRRDDSKKRRNEEIILADLVRAAHAFNHCWKMFQDRREMRSIARLMRLCKDDIQCLLLTRFSHRVLPEEDLQAQAYSLRLKPPLPPYEDAAHAPYHLVEKVRQAREEMRGNEVDLS